MTFTIHKATDRYWHRGNHPFTRVPSEVVALKEVRNLGDGLICTIIILQDHLFIGGGVRDLYGSAIESADLSDTVKVERIGTATTQVLTQQYRWYDRNATSRWGGSSGSWREGHVTQEDCYLPNRTNGSLDFNPRDMRRRPYLYHPVRVTVSDGQTFEERWRAPLPSSGLVTINKELDRAILTTKVTVDGKDYEYQDIIQRDVDDDYRESPLDTLYHHIEGSTVVGCTTPQESKDLLWDAFLGVFVGNAVPMEGVSALYKRKEIAPNIERLRTDAPLDWQFFRWLHNYVTASGKKNNQLLSVFLQEVGGDYDRLVSSLRQARENAPGLRSEWRSYQPVLMENGLPATRAICETLPGAAEKILEIEAAKDFRKRAKTSDQAEGLGVDQYPLLRAAIEDGKIPIGVFNQPGKDGQPVNREFALWEKALGQPGWADTIYEIAQNASGRNTYERDITPYLSFLFKLPKYLDRNAPIGGGAMWSAMPKFVQSQWELEMDEADNENGTQKKRSAFTPVADNEKHIVEIPYVAVAVSGVRTQWCYSRYFYVFEEGFIDPESGGVVLQDREEKLNGRDDYGLCYYTLTGTSTARGYPTFLIIFERLCGGQYTRVHFHRVHPCRSKDKVVTPACNLIEACYQYMAGNIPAKDIAAQQGDLIFIRCDNDPIAARAKVEPDPQSSPTLVFESHALVSRKDTMPLTLHISAAKTPQNRLGFLWAPARFSVQHPEHDNIDRLEGGWYEIRRCKSWEANPKAIWSLTID